MSTPKCSTHCPVCGYELGFLPWDGDSPSDEICPSCGIQFGYSDAAGGDLRRRQQIYREWRQNWINMNMPWSSKGREPPDQWDAREQLRAIGIDLER
jgi:hypothetical protein